MQFFHPLFQTMCMFIGEIGWIFVSANGIQQTSDVQMVKSPRFTQMLKPAICDLFASVFQNLAIAYTYPSHVGVLGSLQVVFTALLSAVYLKQYSNMKQWTGIFFVVFGSVLMVFTSSSANRHAPNPFLGDAFMLVAQIFRPAQYVFEESVLERVDDVMLCVGWEGLWGLLLCLLLSPLFYLIPAPGVEHLDSLMDSVKELKGSRQLQMSASLFVLNVAMYNWLGMTITKKSSSTLRSVLNSIRTASIWILSLCLGWDSFRPLELVGCAFIAFGSYLYNYSFWIEGSSNVDDPEATPLVSQGVKSIP